MKYKRADRSGWQRVTQKRFALMQVDSREFRGYVSLYCIDAVRTPLWIKANNCDICLADRGYMWLQHFPQNAHYTITTILDAQGDLVRWYIDICKQHYLDEHGVYWYVDLYLDLDVSPEGEITILDVDELDDALRQGLVTSLEYELAWREVSSLMTVLEEDALPLLWLCAEYKDQLLPRLRSL